MNPISAMKMRQAFAAFSKNHPKCVMFMKSVFSKEIEEGTIIEMSVQRPGEEKVVTNIKVQKSDIELFESIKGMKM